MDLVFRSRVGALIGAAVKWSLFCVKLLLFTLLFFPFSTLNIVWSCKEQPQAASPFTEIWGEAMRCESLGRWSSRFSASLSPPPQQWAAVLAKRWFHPPWSENKPMPPTKSVPRTNSCWGVLSCDMKSCRNVWFFTKTIKSCRQKRWLHE